MKVLLAGASGLVGTALRGHLEGAGHQVRRLVRGAGSDAGPAAYAWNPAAGQVPGEAVSWAEAVISLNGAPLARPAHTPGRRTVLVSSRVNSAAALAGGIAASSDQPEVWISASAVGFYGDRGEERLTEAASPGQGFLSQLVQDWEAATVRAQPTCRVVLGRLGVVLAGEGALARLVQLARFGLAGRIGSGRQYWSWIGVQDTCRAIDCVLTHQELTGPVNLVSPNPVRQCDLSAALARQLGRPRQIPVPAWAVKVGLGAPAEMLLASQRAVPAALERVGFGFECGDLDDAVGRALG